MINKSNRAGTIYNDLIYDKDKLKVLNFIKQEDINTLTAFNVICEMVFSYYNNSKSTKEYKERFEEIIKYYNKMIENDNKE